jgi:hypothetical protein
VFKPSLIIIKGWYFVSDPHADDGDATPFFANFWEYLAERFDTEYGLTQPSTQQS